MRSSARRSPRRDRQSNALSVMGNLLLLVATLAVAALVAYLVAYPPGALKSASRGSAPTVPATTSAAAPPSGTPAPALSLSAACAVVVPQLDLTDAVVTTVNNDPGALDAEAIARVARDLQTASATSPEELKALIDPLAAQLVELNNAVLAGQESPDFDADKATASTTAARTLCQG